MKDFIQRYKNAECTCDSEIIDEHPCPLKSDVDDNSESLCRCCAHCVENCRDDI